MSAIPVGFCQCGCGEKTAIATSTRSRWGQVKGQPVRFRRGHGMRVGPSLETRFWAKVDRGDTGECWEWKAGRFDSGYGAFSVGRQNRGAHRIAWELTNGCIPDELCICHRCDNPPCCNPAHLFLGTKADNTADMLAKGRAFGGEEHWTRRRPDLVCRGSKQGHARLTEDQVREIRDRAGTVTNRALAAEFGVSESGISKIIKRKNWRHVPYP